MDLALAARPRRASPPLALRLVGALALFCSVVMMAPWLAINAGLSVVVLCRLGLGRGPRALLQAIDYAGAVTLGR